ncbi:MAG: hypothetical protein FJ315_06245, partial [SAR202 cluster bacterium]|nr:hypothetical protein [SAR202 cluster bacterium]
MPALYLLSFVSVAVALGALAWSNGAVGVPLTLAAFSGLGHYVSARWKGAIPRPSVIVMLALALGIWFLRWELASLVTGDSLLSLAKLLAIALTAASFGLRSLRSLYDTLLLSLGVVLMA